VLRDAGSLPPDGEAAELDLLVEPEALGRFEAVVARQGFVQLPSWGHAPHRFFLAYDVRSDVWWKLDVVDRLAFGPGRVLPTRLADACLARRRFAPPLYVPAEEEELVSLLLHCVLDKGNFAPARRRRLAELAGVGLDRARLASLLLEGGWPDGGEGVLAALRAGRFDALLARRGELVDRLSRAARLRTAARGLRRRILRRLDRWLLPVVRRPISVALLAPDGAGKSTLAAALRERLPVPTRSLYMGLYPRDERRLPAGLGFPRRLLRLWVRSALARWHRARGRFVVFDRYGYDARVALCAPASRRRRLRRWLLARSCPPPDLVLLLDAPASVLYARKPEHAPADLEARRAAYRSIGESLPNCRVLDASADPESVRRQATALLWTAYLRGRRPGGRP
jgi:thymidylate kinase